MRHGIFDSFWFCFHAAADAAYYYYQKCARGLNSLCVSSLIIKSPWILQFFSKCWYLPARTHCKIMSIIHTIYILTRTACLFPLIYLWHVVNMHPSVFHIYEICFIRVKICSYTTRTPIARCSTISFGFFLLVKQLTKKTKKKSIKTKQQKNQRAKWCADTRSFHKNTQRITHSQRLLCNFSAKPRNKRKTKKWVKKILNCGKREAVILSGRSRLNGNIKLHKYTWILRRTLVLI